MDFSEHRRKCACIHAELTEVKERALQTLIESQRLIIEADEALNRFGYSSLVAMSFLRGGDWLAPKIFESTRCQLGVTHSALNAPVAEISLERSGISSPIS